MRGQNSDQVYWSQWQLLSKKMVISIMVVDHFWNYWQTLLILRLRTSPDAMLVSSSPPACYFFPCRILNIWQKEWNGQWKLHDHDSYSQRFGNSLRFGALQNYSRHEHTHWFIIIVPHYCRKLCLSDGKYVQCLPPISMFVSLVFMLWPTGYRYPYFSWFRIHLSISILQPWCHEQKPWLILALDRA